MAVRKYTTSQVSRLLGLAEATVRKRADLPVAEVIAGQHFYDADRVDLLRLAKAMRVGDLSDISSRQVIERFVDCVGNRTTEGDREGLDALLEVLPTVLRNASDRDRLRLATAIAKAIRSGAANRADKE